MSYETMERMVIGAIKGAPITSESRTRHFKLRQRAQTPGPGQQEDSSDSSRDASHSGFRTDTSEDVGTGRGERELELFNDSDSSGEMALISQAFKEPCIPTPIARDTRITDSTIEGFGSAGRSSLDATLSELRDRPTHAEPPVTNSGKAPKKKKRGQTRGIPMKEEFFSKIGWTRSFISGPADPLHNPYMVWCHICKKNIEHIYKDQGHFRDFASPSYGETPETRPKMALRTLEERPSRDG